ncbi:MAG: hypothetical protein ACI4GZ_03150 [Ruminococcus sp.]
MLRVVAKGADGRFYPLGTPKSLHLCIDGETPADSFSAVFPLLSVGELSELSLYDGEKLVFTSVVDEQTDILAEAPETELIARSPSALLLDNEAHPQSFVNVSTDIIFSRYLKPYGMKSYIGKDKTLFGEFKVQKGASCWQVLESFSKEAYGAFPRVEGDTVYFEGLAPKKETLVFGQGGIAYSHLERTRLRCKPVSRVFVKTEAAKDYITKAENADAQKRGIVRERYINASNASTGTLKKADELIEKTASKFETAVLYVNQRLTDVLGAKARVNEPELGSSEDYYVSSIRYTANEDGETTKLLLRKKVK